MTLSITDTFIEYNGDDATQVFNIASGGNGIYYAETSEIVVTLTASTGLDTVQVEGVDYTISAANTDSGFVTMTVAPDTGEVLRIERDTAMTQALGLTTAGAFNPVSVMTALDKLTRMAQDRDRHLSVVEAIEYATLVEQSADPTIAPSGKVILYASSDAAVHVVDDAGNDINISVDSAAAAASVIAAAASAAAALVSEGNAATSETNAGSSETAAGVSAAAAAASATAAAAASENLGWSYAFDSATADADPGSAQFRFNHVTFASVTEMYVSETANEGNIAALMEVWDDSTSAIKATIQVRNPLDTTKWASLYVTGTIVDNGTYRTIPVSPIAINDNGTVATTFPNGTGVIFGVSRSGDSGTGAVDSIYARTGDVVAAASDYDASQIDNDSGVAGAFVDDALDTLNTAISTAQAAAQSYADSEISDMKSEATAITGDWDFQGDITVDGVSTTSDDDGTFSTGTYTPTHAGGNIKHITNGGGFALAPPAATCSIIIEMTNNGSAGTMTTAGFTHVDGDALTTTNGDDFMLTIVKTQNFSYLNVKALQ